MISIFRLSYLGGNLLLGYLSLTCSVAAQPVAADGTLSTTVTSPDNLNFTITNGNQPNSGANLFHSFSQFSVPTGGSATFNLVNTPNITTIFSRVTGGGISNIDGLIQTTNNNNPVSLFLINPSGIIFGANARLNIGGSFVGTTANSIKFADGVEFIASDTSNPLLTVASPIGLNMGSNSGNITVQGNGSNSKLNGSSSVSNLTNLNLSGLQVQSGQTLALVGGNISLEGGVISALGGRIELGSVTGGSVDIDATSQGLTLAYPKATSFGNIQMSQRALVASRGTSLGSIQMQGKQVSLSGGSIAVVQNIGSQKAGDITINATESLQVIGMSPDFLSSSGVVNETTAAGGAGNIFINTPQLMIDKGAIVMDRTFSNAQGGNITVKAKEIGVGGIQSGNPAVNPIFGVLIAATFGAGQGGDLSLSTDKLTIFGGGNVGTRTFSKGTGGNVNVIADSVMVSSLDALPNNSTIISLLSANTFSSGHAGNLQLDTRTLSIQDGGLVSVSTVSTGSAGSLTINASESIDVSGVKDSQNPSYIGAVARTFVLTNNPTSQADAGNITINTPTLMVRNGGTVIAENQVLGDAGTLSINANTIQLDNGRLSTSTKVGEGGNINLQVRDLLLLRHGSLISAEAGGAGNGGNISINSPVILGIENSDIIANAIRGAGGNINITTQGLFGLKFRPQLTPENDITASSQFGLSGTVNISNLAFTPTAGLIQLPSNIDDPSQRIAQGCRTYGNSRFVATGRGGLPEDPSDRRSGNHPWTDIRDPATFRSPNALVSQSVKHEKQSEIATPPIVEATGWQINAKGEVDIYAANHATRETTVTDCTGFLAIAPNLFKVKEVVPNEF
ncbi:filamentous hemagglutinin N-terminal domain-containing protein [Pseudanabaena sp. UWO310]|uniref:two-partner secretion domain-containing protein n=1 Tax=Pseudanabaena sp. UWO310 TaxID=2480795 RepID=UPI00115AECF2|nr:filamentous hemagglutinin N-terminal domain-containing protein [Pseudanabaena sp. UWO310]TYQ31338.1 filamentous hemagglutinin N-terminal domain-containing protein [Pseudanabaena sp. UWO310]